MSLELNSVPELHVVQSEFDQVPTVNIRDQIRTPKYTEAIEIPPEIVEQAQEIGNLLVPISEDFPSLIQNQKLRSDIGIPEDYYKTAVEPFLDAPNPTTVFGVDSIIGSDGRIKVIEINTRPQFLGRYDIFNSAAQGKNVNSGTSDSLKAALDSYTKTGISAIISHPSNSFYNYHSLLAQQTNVPISSLQELTTDTDGFVKFKNQKVDVIFRQFSMKSFLDGNITDPKVVDAVKNGKLTMLNGPIIGRFGVKPLLAYINQFSSGLAKYLPGMKVITSGDGTNLHDFKDWWLKTTTGGQTELTIRLTRDNLNSWNGNALKAMVAGELGNARKAIEGKNTPTAQRFARHIEDIQKSSSTKWLLQEQVKPMRVEIDDGNGLQKFNTTLRLYFIRHPGDNQKPKVFLELLAGKYDRVSGAGFTVPLRVS